MPDSSVVQLKIAPSGPDLRKRPHPVLVALERGLEELPPRPAGLFACAAFLLQDAAVLTARPMGLRALRRLRSELFAAPGREPEMHSLWRESVATACTAGILSRQVGLDPALLATAGLLHRMSEVWLLATLARAEKVVSVRLQGAAMQEARVIGTEQLGARMAALWALNPEVSQAALRWRDCLTDEDEHPVPLTPARAVYLAHLLAVEQLHPDFCTPGIIEAAAAELGVTLQAVDAARTDAAGIGMLLNQLEQL